MKPFHEAVLAQIRAHDPDNLAILGTTMWSQDVDIAAKNQVSDANVAYALHFYSCTHQGWLRSKAEAALGLGAALFVTEWGSTHADGGTASNPGVCLTENDNWHAFLDAHLIGSAAWKLVADGDSSSLLKPGSSTTANDGWAQSLTPHGEYVRDLLLRD